MRFCICTDVAARGLDIAQLAHVVNMTLPDKAEDYFHRVGRVGRAGTMGLAVSLTLTLSLSLTLTLTLTLTLSPEPEPEPEPGPDPSPYQVRPPRDPRVRTSS